MSSSYYLLCVSHDPALRIDSSFTSPDAAMDAIAAGLEEHPVCDLLVARVSGALCEVGCPPTRNQRHHPPCLAHGGPKWADADLLRLLTAVNQTDDVRVRDVARSNAFSCWSIRRLHRLRLELGTPALLVLDPSAGTR
ncbi:hypothetical protein ABZ499_33025 [Streptomyces sp. NPDC019990]|uniref:hypothetical protein n=1 Tax=Streptomyces sp. NPDC019990 TaxID=3154693 RepID=UPI00340A6FEC